MFAAVVIDEWKLDIFRKHLERGFFDWEEYPGPAPCTLLLKVRTKAVAALQPVVQAAQHEAARSKMN